MGQKRTRALNSPFQKERKIFPQKRLSARHGNMGAEGPAGSGIPAIDNEGFELLQYRQQLIP